MKKCSNCQAEETSKQEPCCTCGRALCSNCESRHYDAHDLTVKFKGGKASFFFQQDLSSLLEQYHLVGLDGIDAAGRMSYLSSKIHSRIDENKISRDSWTGRPFAGLPVV